MASAVTTAPRCPLTGWPMRFWLHVPGDWRRPGVGPGYDLYWSPRGRYGQVHPRPAAADIPAFYDVDYYTHGEAEAPTGPDGFWGRALEHLAWRADRGSDLTAAALGPLAGSGRRVLEIGCGAGALLAALRAAGWSVVGVEPDPAARAVARGRGLEVLDGTAEDPPALDPGSFDVVVLQHMLEHCLDPFAALRNVARLLAPGGALVVEVPNNDAVGLRAAGAAWPWLDVPRHLNFFTPGSLARACAVAGLGVVQTAFTGYVRQFQRPWLAMERHIRGALAGPSDARPRWSPWRLLAATALGPPGRKYDSVRIVARLPGAAARSPVRS